MSKEQTNSKAIFELQQGDRLRERGDVAQAIACYRRAIALNPGLAKTHQHLAVLLKQQTKLDEANIHYRSEIAPNSSSLQKQLPVVNPVSQLAQSNQNEIAQIYLQQARLLSRDRQWQAAIKACQECLQLAPKTAAAYKIWGDILTNSDKPVEAVGYYAKALTLQPNDSEIYLNLGGLFFQQQQWQQAINYYLKAISINPNLAVAYRNLARVYKQLGKSELVLQFWEKALEFAFR